MSGIFSSTSIKNSIFGTNTFSFLELKLFSKKKQKTFKGYYRILLFLISTTTTLTHFNFHTPLYHNGSFKSV